MTKSHARSSTLKSSVGTKFHMSNPNPQVKQSKYKGVRELGYSLFEKEVDPADVIKFGKRCDMSKPLTNEMVMESHLKEMRDKFFASKTMHEAKRK